MSLLLKTGMDRTRRRTHHVIALFGSPLRDLEDTEFPGLLGPQPQTTTPYASPSWIFSEEVTECPPTPGRDLFPEGPSRAQISARVRNSSPTTKKVGGERIGGCSPPPVSAFFHQATARNYQESKSDDRSRRLESDISPYTSPSWIFPEDECTSEETECPPTPGRDLFPESPHRVHSWNTSPVTRKQDGERIGRCLPSPVPALSPQATTREYQPKCEDHSPRPESDLFPYTSPSWIFLEDEYPSEVRECPLTPGRGLFPDSPSKTPHWAQNRNNSPFTKKDDGQRIGGCSPLTVSHHATTRGDHSKGGECPPTPGSDLFAESLYRVQVRSSTHNSPSPCNNTEGEGSEWNEERFRALGSDSPPTPGSHIYTEYPRMSTNSTPNQNSPPSLTNMETEKTTGQVRERLLSVFSTFPSRKLHMEHSLGRVQCPHVSHSYLFPENQSRTKIILPTQNSTPFLINPTNEEVPERERSHSPVTTFSLSTASMDYPSEGEDCSHSTRHDLFSRSSSRSQVSSPIRNPSPSFINTENEKWIGERFSTQVSTFSHRIVTIDLPADCTTTPGRNLYPKRPCSARVWSHTRKSSSSLNNTENREATHQVRGRCPSPDCTSSLSAASTDYPLKAAGSPTTPTRDLLPGSPLRGPSLSPTESSSPTVSNSEDEYVTVFIGEHSTTPTFTFCPSSATVNNLSEEADFPSIPGRDLLPERPLRGPIWSPTEDSSPSTTNSEDEYGTDLIGEPSSTPAVTFSPSSATVNNLSEEADFPSTPGRDLLPESPSRTQVWSVAETSLPLTDTEDEEAPKRIGESCLSPVSTLTSSSSTMEIPDCPLTPGRDLFSDSPDLSPTRYFSPSVCNTEGEESVVII